MISTEVWALSADPCRGPPLEATAVASPNPPVLMAPFPRLPGPPVPVATPLPNPALATVPETPWLPPVPLPLPAVPPGRSNEPTRATVNLASDLATPATPLGAPNPPG